MINLSDIYVLSTKITCAFFVLGTQLLLIKRGVGIQLTGLTPPHLHACSKAEPGFPMSYLVVCFLCSIG